MASCGSCFPFLSRGNKKASNDGTNHREGLLNAGTTTSPPLQKDEEDVPLPHFDLRRIFSRDIMAIPEHAEVNRGEQTNHTPPPPITALGTTEPVPPPSPLPGPPSKNLERLFSRGAGRNSPVSLNRLFSRGAIGRSSSLGGSWSQQRSFRASTADSRDDDYGEDRIETFTDTASQSNSPLLRKRTLDENKQKDSDLDEDDAQDKDVTRNSGDLAPTTPPAATTLVKQSSSASTGSRVRRRFPELAEATRKLQQVSDHLVVASLKADTRDNEDHTFSGIFFDIEGRKLVPYQFIEIQSISIRGDLGLVSVYSTDKSFEGKQATPEKWTRHFGPIELSPSRNVLRELVLDTPIRLSPGMSKGIYVHSEQPGDMAIVYDDHRSQQYTFEDDLIRMHPGIAHTSNVPFAQHAPWGGSAYRRGREFVGSMRYGIKLLLWTPEVHHHFPRSFRNSIHAFLCCQFVLNKQNMRSSLALQNLGGLPQDVTFHIINMIPWDWFPDPRAESSYDYDSGEDAPDEVRYGGHVGRIAELRRLFDTARQQNAAAVDGAIASGSTLNNGLGGYDSDLEQGQGSQQSKYDSD